RHVAAGDVRPSQAQRARRPRGDRGRRLRRLAGTPTSGVPRRVTPASQSETAEHAGVRLPPPMLYLAGFLAGLLLQLVVPLPGLSGPPALALGTLCGALGVALVAPSVALFRRAGTSIAPNEPTTTLVTSGPYRRTRNPI